MKPFASFSSLALMVLLVSPAMAEPSKTDAKEKDAKPAAATAAAPSVPAPAGAATGVQPAATSGTGTPAATAPAPQRPAQATSLDSLFKLVPEGRTHEGVKYPVMENGVMSSFIQSERMTRIDDNSLQFEDAVINQKGADPLTFRLVRAVYNRATDQLMSNQHSVIENVDYTIEGDSLNYDRKTTISRMTNIRMTIYNMEGLGAAPSPAAAASAAESAAPVPATPPADGKLQPPAALPVPALPAPAPSKK